MPLTQDAIDRLLTVKKHILAEPLRFDMRYIRKPHSDAPCGTTCCIAGWLLKLDKPDLEPSSTDPEFWASPDGNGDVGEAAELLGLRYLDACRLFYHSNWSPSIDFAYRDAKTPAEAALAGAAAIDDFIARGGEWENGVKAMTTPNIDARNGCYGKEEAAPKYDGNLLPAMTAMVTGFVDKLTQERAKLFRETTAALLPEFAHLLKQDGEPNHIPHDCLENLNRDLVCGICGARYEKAKGFISVGRNT